MIKLNNYIVEAWNGVKKQASIDTEAIEAWCDEMNIKNYTINSQGEIDVDGSVSFVDRNIKELPYKFGKINGWFDIDYCENLISLNNCPNKVGGGFSCRYCKELDSLEGCPKEVGGNFWCRNCKRKFTVDEVMSLCKVKGTSHIRI